MTLVNRRSLLWLVDPRQLGDSVSLVGTLRAGAAETEGDVMRKIFSAVAVVIAAVFILAPAAGAQDADDCDIYVTPVVSADGSVTQGGSLSVSGSGFAAGATVSISVNGTAVGTAVADGSGSFSTSVTVPADTPAGARHRGGQLRQLRPHGLDRHRGPLGRRLHHPGSAHQRAEHRRHRQAHRVASATQTPASATLARTGSTSGPLVALAVGLTGLGAIALLAARRRSSDVT